MKISDKIKKVNENYSINMYDNGYMVEVGGRDKKDDWVNCKLLCNTLEEVIELVREIAELPRDQ